jgi:hypothetical protein
LSKSTKPQPKEAAPTEITKTKYAVTAHFVTGKAWTINEFTEVEVNDLVEDIQKNGWVHKQENLVIYYPPQALLRVEVMVAQ